MQGLAQLESMAARHPSLASDVEAVRGLYERRLWHQLTERLLVLVKSPEFDGTDELVAFYNGFIVEFQTRVNAVQLARLALDIMRCFFDVEAGMKFLGQVATVVHSDAQALLLVRSRIAEATVVLEKRAAAETLLEECSEALAGLSGVESVVCAGYYKAKLEFHKVFGSADEFYDAGLKYISYVPIDTMTSDFKAELARGLGLAALVSEKIYNVGEFLADPISEFLAGTHDAWLLEVLTAFRHGSVADFDSLSTLYQSQMMAVPAIAAAADPFALRKKISLLGLMELAFATRGIGQVLSFKMIADHCRIPEGDVEVLIMKAFSLGLLKGKIDGIQSVVRVSWVQPRTLDNVQIRQLADSFRAWRDRNRSRLRELETDAQELLVGSRQ